MNIIFEFVILHRFSLAMFLIDSLEANERQGNITIDVLNPYAVNLTDTFDKRRLFETVIVV